MAVIKEKVICPWCKEEMRPYPHQGYYWFQCKCGARTPTLWHATEERAREKALSYTADVVPKSEVAREIFLKIDYITRRYMDDRNYSTGEMLYDLDELKKKYTEDQT